MGDWVYSYPLIIKNEFSSFHLDNKQSRDVFLVLGPVAVPLWPDDDVVDGDVDELDKEADEAHDGEADGGRDGDLLELWKEGKDWF